MGSFDFTCAVSELSIADGDAVYLVLLSPSPLGLNGGSSSKFEVAFPPMKGVYDSYGFADEIETTAFHDAFARGFGFADAASLVEAVAAAQGRQSPAGGSARPESFLGTPQFALVRQDAWSAMLNLPSVGSDATHREFQSTAALREAAAVQGARLIASLPASLAEPGAAANVFEIGATLLAAAKSGPFAQLHHWNFGLGSSPFKGSAAMDALTKGMAASQASEEDYRAALVLWAETEQVGHAMFLLRKVWMPRDSSGPQGGHNAMHWLWAKELQRLAKAAVERGCDDSHAAARALLLQDELQGAVGPGASATAATSL